MAKLPEFFHFQVLGGLTKIGIQDVSDKDFVEVVRCRDCVHFQQFRLYDGFCKIDGMLWNNDFFCANGKRADDA